MALIDSVAFRTILEEEKEFCDGEEIEIGLDIAIADLGDMPAVDAVPVVLGQWVGEVVMENGHAKQECNVCHKLRIVDNYCPNCGAKMDGRKEDEN